MKVEALFVSILLLTSIGLCCAKDADPDDVRKRELANKAFTITTHIPDISAVLVKSMILARRFDQVERLLDDAEKKYEADISYEARLLRAYDGFCWMGGSDYVAMQGLFDEWVSSKGSHVAYAARGCFKAGHAGTYRGTSYANSVPPEAMKMARSFWESALGDLNRSIAIKEGFIPACGRIAEISMHSGNAPQADAAVSKALKTNPRLFYFRSNYLEYLQPKWGRSYEDAARFIEDAQKYGEQNPRIWSLRGSIPSMLAYQAHLEGKFSVAVTKYSEALQYGDRLTWLRGKAFNQYMLGDYEGAIASMNIVAAYLPRAANGGVLKVISTLQGEVEKKKHEAIPPPAASFNGSTFDGPLDWDDFQ